MSSNPFSDRPENNPYAAPAPGYTGPGYGAPSPGNPLLAPAIILLALSLLTILAILVSLPGQFDRMREVDTATSEGASELTGMLVTLILWPLINAAIALGSVSMIRLKSYRSAYLAAILSLIPICTPCLLLGLPFGIWALVLLNREVVKQRFRG